MTESNGVRFFVQLLSLLHSAAILVDPTTHKMLNKYCPLQSYILLPKFHYNRSDGSKAIIASAA
jgi:hypothetical protein